MQCYHCGKETPSSAQLCNNCGAEIGFNGEIICAAIAKEEKAITYLYNETYNSVYQAIRPLIRDEDTALDILQDTYIKAFESLDQLENPQQFRSWVKRIATNKSKDWLKKKKPTLFSELRPDDESGEVDFLDDREFAQPDAIIDKDETKRLLWEIIDSLSDEQRLVVSLYYFQEMQVKDIALELGISENTVKSRLNYARKNIETKVVALEKKGTKLYSLAPLPFLLWLLRSAAETPSQATLSQITGTLSVSGSSAATTAPSAAATGAGAVGSTAAAVGTGIVAKVIAAVVAVAIAIGGGVILYNNLKPTDEPSEAASGIVESHGPDVSASEPTETPVDLDALNAERIAAYVAYVENVAENELYRYAYKYLLYDTDGDGLDELLATAHSESDVTIESQIFTVNEAGELVPLFYSSDGDGGGRAWMEFVQMEYQGDEYLTLSYSDGGGYGAYSILKPKDDGLEIVHKLEQGGGETVGRFTKIEGAMKRNEFLSTYGNVDEVPAVPSADQANYTGYSGTGRSGGTYRIESVSDEVIQLSYSRVIVDDVDKTLKNRISIYGYWTDNQFTKERLEFNDVEIALQYEKFDFVFNEDAVELIIKVQGYGVEGLPDNGTYILTE